MALIKKGSIYDFSVKVKPPIAQEADFFKHLTTFREVTEITRNSKPISFDLSVSTEDRGLALKSITLEKDFAAFLGNFSSRNLYILSFAWDLSDKPINHWPEIGIQPNDCKFKINAGTTIEFAKAGIPIFPKRKIQGGIAYKIFLMQTESEINNFENFLNNINDTIRRSELSYFLGLLSKVSGVNAATVMLISDAARRLSNALGNIVKANSNDFVDYIEGYYDVDHWIRDFETIEMNSSTVVLNRF